MQERKEESKSEDTKEQRRSKMSAEKKKEKVCAKEEDKKKSARAGIIEEKEYHLEKNKRSKPIRARRLAHRAYTAVV